MLAAIALVSGPAAFIATKCYGSGQSPPSASGPLATYGNAFRDESFTFLTLPEWLIVFYTDEYARFIDRDSPSRYPYFSVVGQYWGAYGAVCAVTRSNYSFQTGYQVMLGVIGASLTAENVLKGAYENTIGRFTDWAASRETPEDAWAVRTAREYGAFMHTVPWYQFPFFARLGTLWQETPLWGPHLLRKWERRFVLSAEYAAKGLYGWVLGAATQGAYDPEALQVYAHIENAGPSVFARSVIKQVQQIGPGEYVVLMPRYEAFTQAAVALDAEGARFVSIAGNDDLLLTAVVPPHVDHVVSAAVVIASLPILTEPGHTRLALRTPLSALHDVMATLRARGATIEHLYDY